MEISNKLILQALTEEEISTQRYHLRTTSRELQIKPNTELFFKISLFDVQLMMIISLYIMVR